MPFNVRLSPEWFLLSRIPGDGAVVRSDPLFQEIEVTALPHWYSHATISWKIPPAWGNCVFHVYSKQADEVTRLTENAINGTFFQDTSLRETSKFHSLDYVVEAILLDHNSVSRRSRPTSWRYKRRSWVELRANEVQRREFMLLSKFAGIKSYLFKKRIYGQRCHRCWNSQVEAVVEDHCPVCYGTSFEGGFFNPYPIFVQFDSSPNDRQKTYLGSAEPNQIGAWTISVPEIDPDDVLIRTGDWSTYRVARTTPTELQTVAVRQILTLSQLSKADIEYTLANRLQSVEGSGYLSDQFPVTPVRPSPVQGLQPRIPEQVLVESHTNPTWLQDMNEESVPIKYSL